MAEKISYESIKYTKPEGVGRIRRKRKLQAWQVLLFFAGEMVLFLTAGGVIQQTFGMVGVAITELMMLALSVGFVRLMSADPGEVFPLARPKWVASAGAVVMWIGAIFAVTVVNGLLIYFFPYQYYVFNSAGDGIYYQLPKFLTLLTAAVLPAICEEALHRGVILNGVRNSVKNKWAVVLIMGVIFAVFHIYPIRYPNMMILGAVMSYVLLLTDNMFYSSLIHLVNNVVALIFTFIGPSVRIGDGIQQMLFSSLPQLLPYLAAGGPAGAERIELIPFRILGVYLAVYGAPVPFLLYTGDYLIKRALAPRKPRYLPENDWTPPFAVIIGSSAAMLLAGLLIILIP